MDTNFENYCKPIGNWLIFAINNVWKHASKKCKDLFLLKPSCFVVQISSNMKCKDLLPESVPIATNLMRCSARQMHTIAASRGCTSPCSKRRSCSVCIVVSSACIFLWLMHDCTISNKPVTMQFCLLIIAWKTCLPDVIVKKTFWCSVHCRNPNATTL